MKKLILLLIVLISMPVFAQKFPNLLPTPPMGWNSWNKFGCNVDEKMIREMADNLVSNGMKAVGYEYIVIDDCWQLGRDSIGNIVADPQRFPSGMKALADYIHSKGLKFGIYSCAGTKTCAGRPGSRGYEYQDARMYAKWGVDYLKYDWCNTDAQNAEGAYKIIRDGLYSAGRPIVLSICEWGNSEPWKWAKDVGHLWRTSGDIQDCFDCKINWGGMGWIHILDKQVDLWKYAGSGHWNDPDMLEVGNGGLALSESRSHFSLWCMLAAPLMAGNDIRNMKPETKEILTNTEIIALDQDKLGKQGFKWWTVNEVEVWAKFLSNGELALCFFNRSEKVKTFDFDWKKYNNIYHDNTSFNIDGSFKIRDLWLKKAIGTTAEPLKLNIPSHDVIVVKLSK